MAGGTWTTQNKVRPGAYINVKSQALNSIAINETGTVTMPVVVGWGPEDKLVEVTAITNIYDTYGISYDDPSVRPIALALDGANKVVTYRLNQGGVAARSDSSLSEITLTAKYTGEHGNKISITVNPSNLNEGEFELKVIYDGSPSETFYFNKWNELNGIESKYLIFSGGTDEAPTGSKTATLASGTNGTIAAGNFQKYLQLVDDVDFNVMALGNVAEDQASTFEGFYGLASAYIRRRRDEYGNKSVLVVYQYPGNPDSEYIISIWNSVEFPDGSSMSPLDMSGWVAGASAGSAPNESLTYSVFSAAGKAHPVDENTPLTNENISEALSKGLFVFTNKRNEVIVEQDINTLHTFTTEKNQEFRKNRVMRVIDFICNDSKQSFEDNFIGQVTNNVEGRELFKSDRVRAFNLLQDEGAIQNFLPDDITVSAGEQKDSVLMEAWVQPTDAMEKLYMSVVVY